MSQKTYYSMGQDATTLYSGTFERSMDAKKRVAVPANWLTKEEGEIFHVIGHPTEGYLVVMPPLELEQQQILINENKELTPAEKRIATRRIFGNAQRVLTDKQGRILLAEEHCKHAGLLDGGITFVGGNTRFEIWSKARFETNEAAENEVFKRISGNI